MKLNHPVSMDEVPKDIHGWIDGLMDDLKINRGFLEAARKKLHEEAKKLEKNK